MILPWRSRYKHTEIIIINNWNRELELFIEQGGRMNEQYVKAIIQSNLIAIKPNQTTSYMWDSSIIKIHEIVQIY